MLGNLCWLCMGLLFWVFDVYNFGLGLDVGLLLFCLIWF